MCFNFGKYDNITFLRKTFKGEDLSENDIFKGPPFRTLFWDTLFKGETLSQKDKFEGYCPFFLLAGLFTLSTDTLLGHFIRTLFMTIQFFDIF